MTKRRQQGFGSTGGDHHASLILWANDAMLQANAGLSAIAHDKCASGARRLQQAIFALGKATAHLDSDPNVLPDDVYWLNESAERVKLLRMEIEGMCLRSTRLG